MNWSLEKVTDTFGVQISNIDVLALSKKDISRVKHLLYRNKLIVIKNQKLEPQDYIKFAQQFGQPKKFELKNYSLPNYPEIMVLNNKKSKKNNYGGKNVGNMWHSDSSYLNQPLPITMLWAKEITLNEGHTLFIDMVAAFKRLTESQKESLVNTYTEHSVQKTYKVTENEVNKSIEEILTFISEKHPPVKHPTIFSHPITKESALYLSPGYSSKIIDFSIDESNKIFHEIFQQVIQKKYTLTFKWEKNDLVIWDNRSLIHSATEISDEADRIMYRIGVQDCDFFKGD